MVENISLSRRVFMVMVYIFLSIASAICLLPLIHILALSFSSSTAAESGLVKIWPVDFTLNAYKFLSEKPEFIRAFIVSFERLFLGVSLNMLLTILMAYPLSKSVGVLSFRKVYTWFLMIAMLFSGGLIPTYMVVKDTGLIDSLFALVIPGAVPIFNVIVLMNFFRGLPKEIEEAAFIDGANHVLSLVKIYLPLSLPSLATLILFAAVGHWNAWFDGIIYMNRQEHYPLTSYLQTIIIKRDLTLITIADLNDYLNVSDRTSRAAQVFVGMLPILAVYPFLQRYFMTGLVIGSVKG